MLHLKRTFLAPLTQRVLSSSAILASSSRGAARIASRAGANNQFFTQPFASAFRSLSALPDRHGTTILCVRKDGIVCMAGDGQVSLSHTVVKGNAKKVRRIGDNILVGFAGSTADALTLLERLEKKLEEYPGQLTRACVELAKAWRTDKYLRKLEAALLVADANNIFELTGNGDVLEPETGVMSVGSGGSYALSAALALLDVPGMSAEQIVRKSMKIAGDICVYTNHNLTLETIKAADKPAPPACSPPIVVAADEATKV